MTSTVYQIISFHPSRLLYAHTPLERYIRAVAFFLLNPVDHGGLSRIFVVAHGQFQVGLVAVVVENSYVAPLCAAARTPYASLSHHPRRSKSSRMFIIYWINGPHVMPSFLELSASSINVCGPVRRRLLCSHFLARLMRLLLVTIFT